MASGAMEALHAVDSSDFDAEYASILRAIPARFMKINRQKTENGTEEFIRQVRHGDPARAPARLAQDAAGDRRRGRLVGHQLLDPHQEAGGAGRDQALHGRPRRAEARLPRFGDRAAHAGEPQRRDAVRVRPRAGHHSRSPGGLPGLGRLRLLHPHRGARHARLRAAAAREALQDSRASGTASRSFVLRVLKEASVPLA